MTPGERACEWIRKYCRIPEGPHVGQPVELAPFMVDDIKAIYDNPAGTRRAILCRGRKNAKTTESAFLVLLHLCGPMHVRNSHIYSVAQALQQAGILFGLAAKMVRMSPALRSTVQIKDSSKMLVCAELGTQYRALSAETSTAYGLNPVLTIHDELGQVHGPRSPLYEALETATAAQEKPLSIIISTQAKMDGDLLSMLIDDAKAGHDPRTVLRLHVAPDDLDPFSDEAIRAANPAFDCFMNRDEVRSMAADARRMSARENEYRNLVLNQRVDALSHFIPVSVWKENAASALPLDECEEVFGGLDLSSTTDLTALVLIGKIKGIWHIEPHFWTPAEGLAERARLDRNPYDIWAEAGFLKTTPGRTVDYDFIVDQLLEVFDRYPVKKIGFDKWRFEMLKSYLTRAGMSEETIKAHFVPFGQSFRGMSDPYKELLGHLNNKRMAHGGHPVLQMCALNATAVWDNKENVTLVKKRHYGRIDGIVALAMAVGCIPVPTEAAPAYQLMFFGR